jgi:nicotinamidase-related amidase
MLPLVHNNHMRVIRDNTAAIIIDVQEKLLPHMDQHEQTLQKLVTLVRGLGILAVPAILTEQYPQGLGPTVPPLREAFGEQPHQPSEPLIKAAFSCCDDAPFMERLAGLDRPVVIVAGIEAHVCVLQTTVDLLDRDYTPVVVMDAVSSRSARDREIAARRLEREGARLTTVESVLFELTRVSGTEEFKAISRLIK